MTEPRYENEDRFTQQGGRRSQWDERRQSRGYQGNDDRYESSDRNRHSQRENFGRFPESDRRYTSPNDEPYENELERTGTPRFNERRMSEYDRGFDHEPSYGSRGSSRSNRSQEYNSPHQNFGNRDYSQSGTLGHADWNTQSDWNRSSGFSGEGYGRNFYPRQDSSSSRRFSTSDGGYGVSDRIGNSYRHEGQGMGDQHYDHNQFNQQRNRWPKGFKRSDERLKDDIQEALIRNSHIDASELEVQVKDGEVTLTGTVHSREEKRMAEEVAEVVIGVQEVQNNLRVGSKSQNTSDKSGSTAASSSSNRMSVAGQTENNTSSGRTTSSTNK